MYIYNNHRCKINNEIRTIIEFKSYNNKKATLFTEKVFRQVI